MSENMSAIFAANVLDADFTDYIVNGVNIAGDRQVQNTPEDMAYLALVYDTAMMGGAASFNVNMVRNAVRD